MQDKFRSKCAISSGLDLFGDKWSLLIIRDLLFHKKQTFKGFSLAGENISSARLSDRLSKLELMKILIKSKHPTNKKVYIYQLTQKGLDLAPLIGEYINWSNKYLHHHISDNSKKLAKALKENRDDVLRQFQNQ